MYLDLIPVWEGFLQLTETRDVTNTGIGPIKFSEIGSWLDLHRIVGDKRVEWARYFRALDRKYLELLRNA